MSITRETALLDGNFEMKDEFEKFSDEIGRSSPQRLIILDFDETLFLKNSTETFLDQAQPKFLVAPILALIDIIAPWRFFRLLGMTSDRAELIWRDWLRVVTVVVLCPWSILTWRSAAPALAAQYRNRALTELLAHRPSDRVVVASLGFRALCRPLVRHLAPGANLVAAPLATGWNWRRQGKWRGLNSSFSKAELADAVFLTDSAVNDSDVIAQVEQSFVWRSPDADYSPATAHDYVPFRYTSRVKHAKIKAYVAKVFYGEDWLALYLATVFVSPMPILLAPVTMAFIASYFLIFELGYWENDKLGLEREADPVVSTEAGPYIKGYSAIQAWAWALIFAAAGAVGLVFINQSPSGAEMGVRLSITVTLVLWSAFLVLSRLIFAVFNRLDKPTRTFVYLPLQLTKGLGIVSVLMLPVHAAGLAILSAQAIARWMAYVTYRSGADYTVMYLLLWRLMAFGVIGACLIWLAQPQLVSWIGGGLILAWCLYTARRELWSVVRRAHFLPTNRTRVPEA